MQTSLVEKNGKLSIPSNALKTNRIIRFFPESDMRCGHVGLAKHAKKRSINVKELRVGEYVVFLNARKNNMKIYTTNNIIVHLRTQNNSRIDLRVVRMIPEFFKGGNFDYSGALRKTIEDSFGYRSKVSRIH